MGRHRQFDSAAERQRAYRQRLAEKATGAQPVIAPKIVPKPRRPPSRPARLTALTADAQQLLDEYQHWFESMPEPLQDSEQGQRLSETVDQLTAIVDMLSELNPPRGFGRD